MSEKKGPSRAEKRAASFAQGDALLVGFLGFGLVYVVMVPHTFSHLLHWLSSAVGAFLSFVLMWIWLSIVRPWRMKRMLRRSQAAQQVPQKK